MDSADCCRGRWLLPSESLLSTLSLMIGASKRTWREVLFGCGTKDVGKPHVLLCPVEVAADATLLELEFTAVGADCFLRLGVGASSKVQACL
jgi:hypothetical protein